MLSRLIHILLSYKKIFYKTTSRLKFAKNLRKPDLNFEKNIISWAENLSMQYSYINYFFFYEKSVVNRFTVQHEKLKDGFEERGTIFTSIISNH